MTFPSSPFPRAYCWSLDKPCLAVRCPIHDQARSLYHYAQYNYSRHAHRFPILRSSPLWQPVWVAEEDEPGLSSILKHRYDGLDHRDGIWFPPLQCGPNGFGDRKKLPSDAGWRLFSSPLCRCTACLTAADAIEIMLVGIAYEMRQWPDEWEHRCYFSGFDGDRHLCAQCDKHSLTNPIIQRILVESTVHEWVLANRGKRCDTFDAMRDAIAERRRQGVSVQSITASPSVVNSVYDELSAMTSVFSGPTEIGAPSAATPVSAPQVRARNGYAMTILGVDMYSDPAVAGWRFD